MQVNGHILKILPISILSLSVLSCGGNRVNIEFKTPREIYVDDSKTDPDKLNKELEYDLRESEKNAGRKSARQKSQLRQKQKQNKSWGGTEVIGTNNRRRNTQTRKCRTIINAKMIDYRKEWLSVNH